MSRKNIIQSDRGKVIDDIVNSMIKLLNTSVDDYKLTFEEALSITDKIRLHILSKYIDFRMTRMISMISRVYNEREGVNA